jgi:hypothetical protein
VRRVLVRRVLVRRVIVQRPLGRCQHTHADRDRPCTLVRAVPCVQTRQLNVVVLDSSAALFSALSVNCAARRVADVPGRLEMRAGDENGPPQQLACAGNAGNAGEAMSSAQSAGATLPLYNGWGRIASGTDH